MGETVVDTKMYERARFGQKRMSKVGVIVRVVRVSVWDVGLGVGVWVGVGCGSGERFKKTYYGPR